ncbi:MAG: haloacid dehalogenase-like hydrolase [Planctomycetaceae bacterium]|jgi:phosphoglycolate phosphatase-like HAD superfamily hydrolase|nr:haloacid dehalogenase-like hydrolase [Planctomycetaceae bacterium]
MFSLEIAGADQPAVPPKVAMLDFDGTITVIREGWQTMLLTLFLELLRETPRGKQVSATEIEQAARRGIESNIGKKPIYQCFTLSELIRQFGGTPLSAEQYNEECERRLNKKVLPRMEYLHRGGDPAELMIPGTLPLLSMLKRHRVKLYLVSGTEDDILKSDAKLLGITDYFDGGLFGSLPDPEAFSKAKIVSSILRDNPVRGEELLGIGDGRTETVDVKNVGGFTIGVASDEEKRQGVDAWKREQLLRAGADWIIPDYTDIEHIEQKLFPN